RRGDAAGNVYVADHGKIARKRFVLVRAFRNRIRIEHGARRAIRGAIRAWQHDGSANLLPVLLHGKLLFEYRRVGHYLIGAAVMDDLLSFDILDDCTVARGV